MKIAVFSAQPYDRKALEAANKQFNHEIDYHETRLTSKTAVLASGSPAVCLFVNDEVGAEVLETLAKNGTKLVAMRCTGFNNVDLKAAKAHGITVTRVPRYSPHAVSEYTMGLFLTLDRKIHRAWDRVREDNFDLNGLIGNDLYGRTIGVIGTGRVGSLVAKTFRLGFDCNVIAHDIKPNPDLEKIGVRYTDRDKLIREADVISLHYPLNPDTKHVINAKSLETGKDGVVIVNTGRGGLIDTAALVDAIESGKVGGAALDVYEEEVNLFFRDMSEEVVRDAVFQRLIAFPNVIVTGHQAFFTKEALHSIAQVTLDNATRFGTGNIDPENLL